MNAVTESDALDQILAGRKAVVLFQATWCSHCRRFRPLFESLADGGAYDAVEAVIDDEDNVLWDKYSIDVVPTVVFFDDGAPLFRLDGRLGVGLTAEQLQHALRERKP